MFISTKLIRSETINSEKRWIYPLTITFNNQKIIRATITDHTWRKKGREKITHELILNILQEELNNKRFSPTDYSGQREVFIRDRILYQDKRYRLVFWFKDRTTNHLWIRNCHPQD